MDQFPDKSFKVRRAVPPGKVIFFFSFHGVPKVLNSYEIEQLKTPFSRELQFHGDIRKKVSMKLANSIQTNGIVCTEDAELVVEPRPNTDSFIPSMPSIILPDWHHSDSIFKDYVLDDDKLLVKCFEEDWKNTKIKKIIDKDKFANLHDKDEVARVL